MPPLRPLLIVAAAIVGSLLFAVFIGSTWINSFVHSDAFRNEVERRASQTVGGPVEIKQIDFNIWSGVKLLGLATKFQSDQGTLVAQVKDVNCSYSLFALLEGKLQFNGVTLKNPQVVLTQLPASTVATPRPPATPPTTATPDETQSGKTAPIDIIVEAAKIVDGRLSIEDGAGTTKADLQGVQMSANTSGYASGKNVTGTLRIASVALPQNLGLSDFSTPFTYRGGYLQAGPFEATSFQGRLTGNYKLDNVGPSLLEIDATHIDVAKVGTVANPQSPSQLTGSLSLQSKWHGVETGTLTGEGDAQISDGRLGGITILRDLATALRVPGLNDPVLRSVTTHFQVGNGLTHFTDLHIQSVDFEMEGSGVIDAQGRLNADMVLTLHGEAMGGIPGAAASFFSKLPGGAGSIPFHISGTVANPQADLSTRLFLQSSKVEKSINKVFNQLFH